MSAAVTGNKKVYFVWLVLVCCPGILYMMFWLLYELANTYALYLGGAIVSVAGIGVLSSLIGWWDDPLMRRAKEIFQKDLKLRIGWLIMGFSFSITSIFISVTMFAWISYCLIRLGFAGCVLPESTHLTYEILVQTYWWHLGDLIPQSNIEKTLGAQRPAVECRGWVAAPMLGFRLFTYVILFEGIRNAWTTFRAANKS